MFRIVLVLFVVGCGMLEAQARMEIHDSSLQRGKHEIPLYATLSTSGGDSVCVTIAFDPNLVDIRAVSTSLTNISYLRYDTVLINFRRGELHLYFNTSGLSLVNTKICTIGIELLAGADSITSLTPTYLCKNGVALSSATLAKGTLYILDAPPTVLIAIEGLGMAFANPSATPSFRYYLIQKSDIHFTIFDVAGREVLEEHVMDVPSGSRVFSFTNPDYITLCDGPYFLRMRTLNGVYVQPFIVEH